MISSENVSSSPLPLGAVLAGGRSRRFGRDKTLEVVAGRSLVQGAVETLTAVLRDVIVVGAGEEARRLVTVEALEDLVPDHGPMGGLQTALERARGGAVFVLACDLPFVGPELVRHLLARATEGSGREAVVPLWQGRLQPLCGIYGPGCLPLIEARLERGRLAVHGLLDDLDVLEVPIGPEQAFDRPELLLNVNRVEDLDLARSLAGWEGATDA